MSNRSLRQTVPTWHRWTGITLSLPLFLWVVSASVLHYVGTTAPNGLQGVYDLNPYNSIDLSPADAVIPPSDFLAGLGTEYGIERVHWIRLESYGDRLLYIVKPTPYELAMTFDARLGDRLDPLSDELILAIANEKLLDTKAVRVIGTIGEYHRDYDQWAIPSARVLMEGAQPSEIILSRASGRTLRRSDDDAQTFNWWYRNFHVFQFNSQMTLFTSLLFSLAIGMAALAVFGLLLWWWRRGGRIPESPTATQRALIWHRRFGLAIGVFLIVEVLVGSYMWLSLGPLQDPFRGKNTFNTEWTGGFSIGTSLDPPERVMATVGQTPDSHAGSYQSIEWRVLDGAMSWIVVTRRNEPAAVYGATDGRRLDPLPPEAAGRIVQESMLGAPSFEYVGETPYYWNDLNRPIATYRFRFDDPAGTEVYAAQTTGEIVSRRTSFWRAFSPFLMIHTLAFTRNTTFDTVLLSLFQLGLIALMLTGLSVAWLMRKRRV